MQNCSWTSIHLTQNLSSGINTFHSCKPSKRGRSSLPTASTTIAKLFCDWISLSANWQEPQQKQLTWSQAVVAGNSKTFATAVHARRATWYSRRQLHLLLRLQAWQQRLYLPFAIATNTCYGLVVSVPTAPTTSAIPFARAARACRVARRRRATASVRQAAVTLQVLRSKHRRNGMAKSANNVCCLSGQQPQDNTRALSRSQTPVARWLGNSGSWPWQPGNSTSNVCSTFCDSSARTTCCATSSSRLSCSPGSAPASCEQSRSFSAVSAATWLW